MRPLPKAIFFDLDGTLIDSAADLTVAVDQMLIELNLPVAGFDRVSGWIGNGAQKLIERALIFAQPDLSTSQALVEYTQARTVFDRVYGACCQKAKGLYPGAEELLAYCSMQQIPLALITNKPEAFTRLILNGLALTSKFKVIVGGDTLPERKPSALPLRYAADKMKVNPADCWMIGDSMSDVAAAKNAGCTSVAVSYGYNHGRPVAEELPDLLCDSLNEVQQLMSQPLKQGAALEG
ncbi:phosphoglycolate phosphatase [Litoribacillus peritrichatus]|uniref:Phosphoglycolate phosphatase n=1 Tax=Litoribacillus peritrichatus TaxID=718191 RepID=A0ABP7LZZ4_9GAMM